MKYANQVQINLYADDNNLVFLYRGIKGLHFRDIQDKSHYIIPERCVVEA